MRRAVFIAGMIICGAITVITINIIRAQSHLDINIIRAQSHLDINIIRAQSHSDINIIRAQSHSDIDQQDISRTFNTFQKSYNEISDEMLAHWDSTFAELGIKDEPLAIMIYFIRLLSRFDTKTPGYFSLKQILLSKKSNLRCNAVSTAAIMQKLGWAFECFYNKDECYLGSDLTDDWQVRKGSWIEKDGHRYYLKEFDDCTPTGELKADNPASTYQSLALGKSDLKPVPLIKRLPKFGDSPAHGKKLKWHYQNRDYELKITIPDEQLEWSRNLPPSLYGMVSSGIKELTNIGLVDSLKSLIRGYSEFEAVNFLLKFCQSERIFSYDSGLPIKSVSQQLRDGRNDCDGRSVFLYCLLYTVPGYAFEDIVFISWPNHLTLGLRPRSAEAEDTLKKCGSYVGEEYYILDGAFAGDTHWGSKMKKLSDQYEIISQH